MYGGINSRTVRWICLRMRQAPDSKLRAHPCMSLILYYINTVGEVFTRGYQCTYCLQSPARRHKPRPTHTLLRTQKIGPRKKFKKMHQFPAKRGGNNYHMLKTGKFGIFWRILFKDMLFF